MVEQAVVNPLPQRTKCGPNLPIPVSASLHESRSGKFARRVNDRSGFATKQPPLLHRILEAIETGSCSTFNGVHTTSKIQDINQRGIGDLQHGDRMIVSTLDCCGFIVPTLCVRV